MSMPSLSSVAKFIRQIKQAEEECALTDADLLERFTRDNDPSAFSILVRRHGSMVFGVSRRILRNSHDAEDVFQATFLILMKKAGAIGRKDLLSNWLYGVAYRVALRAKAKAAKRQEKERKLADRAADCSLADLQMSDLCDVLDEELQRLPDKYRLPLILSLLQDMTKSKIAKELGWPEGTVAVRLTRGKERLRERLNRRGITVTTVALTAALTQTGAFAQVPALLLNATLDAIQAVGGTSVLATGAASELSVELAHAVTKSMLLTRLLKAGVLVFASSLLLGGASAAYLAVMSNANATHEDEEHLKITAKRQDAVELEESAVQRQPEKIPASEGAGRQLMVQIRDGVLTGKVLNAGPGPHNIIIEWKDKKFASVQTDRDGGVAWLTGTRSQGAYRVRTLGPDHREIGVPDVFVDYFPVRILEFETVRGKGDSWTFRGRVGANPVSGVPEKSSIVSDPTYGTEISFTGITELAGKTAPVDGDGLFSITVDLPPNRIFSVRSAISVYQSSSDLLHNGPEIVVGFPMPTEGERIIASVQQSQKNGR